MRLESGSREMTVICIGGFRCPYYPECVDPNRCLLDEEAQEIMAENKEKEEEE